MHVRLPPTTYDQRAPLYADVETLLDHGFLSCTFAVNDVVMSIRSLTPNDQFLLRHRVHGVLTDEWRVQVIAASVWMVGGYNFIGDTNVAPRLAATIRGLPHNIKSIMFNSVTDLLGRVGKAIDAVESYAYEGMSRYKWRTMGKQSFDSYNGRDIGTNHVQRMWTHFNMIEDQRITEEAAWEGFKLVASAQAPKGVKKINNSDRQTRQLEIDRRQTIHDKFYYIAKGVVKPSTDDDNKKNGPHLGPKTADNLVEEMHRWVTGDDDWHDAIVNQYKQTISDNFEKHKAEMAERAEILAAAREVEDDRPRPMVVYTAEQLAEILKDRRPGPAGVRQIGGDGGEERNRLYNKYLSRVPDSGALRVASNGRMAIVDPNADQSPELSQRIADRQVIYRPDSDDLEDTKPLQNEW